MRTLVIVLALAGAARGQSLLDSGVPSPYDPPGTTALRKHDHVRIQVVERTRAQSAAELRTDRRSRTEIDLQEWFKFDNSGKGLPNLTGTPLAGAPGADLDARMRSDNSGRTSRQFDLSFTITAEVADIRPNGTLVLQAIKRRKVNDDDEVIKLTGEVAPDVVKNGMVQSDNLVNLHITYEGSGSVSDQTKPGFLTWVLNKIWPF